MRRVPELLKSDPALVWVIGNGRLAHYLSGRFRQFKIPFYQTKKSREFVSSHQKSNRDFRRWLEHVKNIKGIKCIWIAVSDHAIDSVTKKLEQLAETHLGPNGLRRLQILFIHSSGANSAEGVRTLHPLVSIRAKDKAEDFYWIYIKEEWKNSLELQKVRSLYCPWIASSRWVGIKQSDRVLYHFAAVAAANIPQIIWGQVQRLLRLTNVPWKIYEPLILRSLTNISLEGSTAVTGPIIRGDGKTIRRHLNSLLKLNFNYNSWKTLYKWAQKAHALDRTSKRKL